LIVVFSIFGSNITIVPRKTSLPGQIELRITLAHPAAVFQHFGLAEDDQRVEELRRRFLPQAFTFEVGGEVIERETAFSASLACVMGRKLGRDLFEGEMRNVRASAGMFDSHGDDVAGCIDIQQHVFVEVARLGNVALAELAIKRIGGMKLLDVHFEYVIRVQSSSIALLITDHVPGASSAGRKGWSDDLRKSGKMAYWGPRDRGFRRWPPGFPMSG